MPERRKLKMELDGRKSIARSSLEESDFLPHA
jgi:hypothetical protein